MKSWAKQGGLTVPKDDRHSKQQVSVCMGQCFEFGAWAYESLKM